MKTNLERKIEQAIKVTLDAQRGKSRDEALIKMAQGRAPFKLFLFRVKYYFKVYFRTISILSFLLVSVIVFLNINGEIAKYKQTKPLTKNNLNNDTIIKVPNDQKKLIHNNSKPQHIEKSNKKFSHSELTKQNLLKDKTNVLYDETLSFHDFKSKTISVYDVVNYESNKIILNKNIGGNTAEFEYNFIFNIHEISDSILYCNTSDNLDTLVYSEIEIKLRDNTKKWPQSSKIGGTPSYLFSDLFDRKNYIILVFGFNGNNLDAFYNIETSTNCFTNWHYVSKRKESIIFAIKIRKSNKLRNLKLRAKVENVSSDSSITSGITYGKWIDIPEW